MIMNPAVNDPNSKQQDCWNEDTKLFTKKPTLDKVIHNFNSLQIHDVVL